MTTRAEINTDWKFPNDTYIFDANGIQIDPKSKEGNDIVYILWRQEKYRLSNKEQQELVKRLREAKNAEEAIEILRVHREAFKKSI